MVIVALVESPSVFRHEASMLLSGVQLLFPFELIVVCVWAREVFLFLIVL